MVKPSTTALGGQERNRTRGDAEKRPKFMHNDVAAEFIIMLRLREHPDAGIGLGSGILTSISMVPGQWEGRHGWQPESGDILISGKAKTGKVASIGLTSIVGTIWTLLSGNVPGQQGFITETAHVYSIIMRSISE
ncbi:hypothetical protein Tdes44962_MAKER08310 [Teratosphaeria destructans]|uniref:Uncharacterized protein n=1 Tax=Teratosphaeria destructans TaxID=418781 RepID=A0A9W7SX09_9PEZI|nr:hypothetical protein Tdes44962_MAKER08310 [Teratosphaeria destructans]